MSNKKILLSMSLRPTCPVVTLESIRESMQKLGIADMITESEIMLGDSSGFTKSVKVFIPADDDEPYLLVKSNERDVDGRELSDDEIENLRFHGICTAFEAEYPRSNEYGAPFFSAYDAFAEAEVAEHLFRVDENVFTVHTEDRGDDGATEIWLTIAVPDSLHAELMAATESQMP